MCNVKIVILNALKLAPHKNSALQRCKQRFSPKPTSITRKYLIEQSNCLVKFNPP